MTKAHATIGMWVMTAAAIVGILIVGVSMAAGELRTALGVDLTQWIALSWGIAGGLYSVGKGIYELGQRLGSGGVPELPPGGTDIEITGLPDPIATPATPQDGA